MKKSLFKKIYKKIDKRLAVTVTIFCVIVGGTAYAEFRPTFDFDSMNNSYPTVPVDNSLPSASPSSTPSPSLEPSPAPQSTVKKSTTMSDDTAICNQILAEAQADINALIEKGNAEMAQARQMISNQGSSVYQQTNNSNTASGMVNQSTTSSTIQQLEDAALADSQRVQTDRQNYINQLNSLQCWHQAGVLMGM